MKWHIIIILAFQTITRLLGKQALYCIWYMCKYSLLCDFRCKIMWFTLRSLHWTENLSLCTAFSVSHSVVLLCRCKFEQQLSTFHSHNTRSPGTYIQQRFNRIQVQPLHSEENHYSPRQWQHLQPWQCHRENTHSHSPRHQTQPPLLRSPGRPRMGYGAAYSENYEERCIPFRSYQQVQSQVNYVRGRDVTFGGTANT